MASGVARACHRLAADADLRGKAVLLGLGGALRFLPDAVAVRAADPDLGNRRLAKAAPRGSPRPPPSSRSPYPADSIGSCSGVRRSERGKLNFAKQKVANPLYAFTAALLRPIHHSIRFQHTQVARAKLRPAAERR